MKYIFGILLFAILGIGTNSCQKEFVISGIDSTLTTPPGSSVTGTFTATINGVQFVANKVAAASKTLNVIAITGQDNNGRLIVLRVADSGVHVYSLDFNSSSNAGVYTKDNGNAYTTNQGADATQSFGTLSVTSINTANQTMSGTFSMKLFRAADGGQINVTEGVFTNISYATQALPPANSADTFNVKIDGVQFPGFSISGVSAFGLISVQTSNQDVTKTVGISVTSTVTPGSYSFAAFSTDYIGQYNIGMSYLLANAGTLTILENNSSTKRIRGNFNFSASEITGTQSAELTNGYFSVTYQ